MADQKYIVLRTNTDFGLWNIEAPMPGHQPVDAEMQQELATIWRSDAMLARASVLTIVPELENKYMVDKIIEFSEGDIEVAVLLCEVAGYIPLLVQFGVRSMLIDFLDRYDVGPELFKKIHKEIFGGHPARTIAFFLLMNHDVIDEIVLDLIGGDGVHETIMRSNQLIDWKIDIPKLLKGYPFLRWEEKYETEEWPTTNLENNDDGHA